MGYGPKMEEDLIFEVFDVVTRAMRAELARAAFKHGGVHQTPANPDMPVEKAFVILAEEFGEVARAITYDEGSTEQLIKEAIQTATMAAGMAVAAKIRLARKDV